MIVKTNVDLAAYTSLKTGGPAGKLIELEPGDDLQEVIRKEGQQPKWVLGFGTNCLISDSGLPGTTIINRHGRIDELGPTKYKVSSGLDWDKFIEFLISKGLWGLEFTSGIPGGVGAAITGNIAAYGHQVADHFVEATILDTNSGDIKVWDKVALSFEYRASILQKPENAKLVVLDATFELSSSPTSQMKYKWALKTADDLGLKPDTLANRRRIILETRRHAGSLLMDREKGPWTAGSFFKNPLVSEDKIQELLSYEEAPISREELIRQNIIHGGNKMRVSAAHVLLAAGFKRGQKWGNVGLHPDHILKIENLGDASAQEIYNVVQKILDQVEEKVGIILEPEVRFLGKFKK